MTKYKRFGDGKNPEPVKSFNPFRSHLNIGWLKIRWRDADGKMHMLTVEDDDLNKLRAALDKIEPHHHISITAEEAEAYGMEVDNATS